MSNLNKSSKTKQVRSLEKAMALATDQLSALSYLHGRANAIRAASPAAAAADAGGAAGIWDETYRQLRALYIKDGCPADEVTRTALMLGTPWLGYSQQSHDDFILREVVPWFGTTIYRTGNIGGKTVSDHVDTVITMGGQPH